MKGSNGQVDRLIFLEFLYSKIKVPFHSRVIFCLFIGFRPGDSIIEMMTDHIGVSVHKGIGFIRCFRNIIIGVRSHAHIKGPGINLRVIVRLLNVHHWRLLLFPTGTDEKKYQNEKRMYYICSVLHGAVMRKTVIWFFLFDYK
jgi:hypothetical protein